MKTFLPSMAVALFVAAAAAPARAEFAYGVTLVDNQLISIDMTTGLGTMVAPLSAPISPFGLASVNNNLYTFDSTAEVIRQINTTTGAFSATYNIGIGPVLGQGGMAFQSSTVGFLTTALDADPNSPTYLSTANDLYRFNLATGTTTFIAHTADTLESIAFGPGGILYGLGKLDGNLYVVDPTTGGTTLVGNTGVGVGSPVGALSFDPSGALFATIDDALYQLNTTTGAATAVGDPTVGTGFSSISGISFAASPGVVPEPASVVLLGLGLAVPYAAMIRKRLARRAA